MSVLTAKRIPSMDGLRAISIVFVLYGHMRLTHGFPIRAWKISHVGWILAAFGVCLFFVISGFLITTLILNEKDRFGNVSLRNFYARRSLRIFPAFYVFICVAILLRHVGYAHFTNLGLLASATYWRNLYPFQDVQEWLIGHAWSLSVEEQFYLMWPFVVARLEHRRAIWAAVALVALWPLLRFLRHGFLFAGSGPVALDTAAGDTIMYGCLLALLARDERHQRWLHRLARQRAPVYAALSALLVLYSTCAWWPAAATFLLPLIRNLALVVFLWWAINNPAAWLGRVLNSPIAVYLGVISYSLYIWQQVFLFPDQNAWICRFPQNVVAAIIAASISYYVIEQPMNRLRARFAAHAHQPVQRPAATTVQRSPAD